MCLFGRQCEGQCPAMSIRRYAAKPPRERRNASRSLRLPCIPFFSGPGRLVMSTDRRALEKDHAEGLIPVFDLLKEALPHPRLRPANEQLCGNPPGTKLRWQGAPLRAVLMAPENRRDRPSKIFRWGLSLRTDFFDQRLPDGPGGVILIINSYAVRSVIQDSIGANYILNYSYSE